MSALLLFAGLGGCATSVPASETFRARTDALVGRPQHEAYLAFGAPTRTTDDGAGGRIVRWEWTRTSVTPGTATSTTHAALDTTSATVLATTTTTTQPPTVRADLRYVEVFVRPDGTVYHTRHDARTPAEDRARRNRLLLRTAGVTAGLVAGGLTFSALTF